MSTALARLAWKDAAIIWPIVAVITLTIVVVNALLMFAHYLDPQQTRGIDELASVAWVLLPGLLAFGLPAMLVGTEQESGTLNWLRTLAVPRRLVINSKLLVAVMTILSAWLFSAIALQLVLFVLESVQASDDHVQHQLPYAMTLYVTLQLLFASFVTSYLFRSPIAALFAVIPLMIPLAILDGLVYDAYERSNVSLLGFIGLGVLCLLVLLGMHYWLAERRMRLAKTKNAESMSRYLLSRMLQFSTAQNESEYQLNFQLRLPIPKLALASACSDKRPSVGRAMLWQAASQQFLAVSVLAIPCFLAILYFSFGDRAGILLTILPMGWIGCLAFYHDSLNRRYLFYGERGFSVSRVWVTRMAMPICVVLLMYAWSVWILNRGYQFGVSDGLFISSTILFACGVLASVWVTRPVLAFLVGPVLAASIGMALGSGLQPYPDYLAFWSLAAIPVLFATWRLQRRWMNGQRDFGFHWRCVAYVLLGPLVVYISVYGHRFATMPKEIPQWRAATFAEASEITFKPSPEMSDGLLDRYRSASSTLGLNQFRNREANYVNDLIQLFRLSRQVREAVVDGHVDPQFILTSVERDEARALFQLQSLEYSYPSIPDDVVELLPSDQIRSESRRLALLAAWHHYQTQSWEVEGGDQRMYRPKTFAGLAVCPWRYKLTFEQARADRAVDLATQATLEYVERGNVHSDTNEMTSLWQEALGPYVDSRKSMPISLEADTLIARFRELASRDQ